MKNKLNSDFIHVIQEMLPEKENLANRIMNILEIGKEATYRRLRNDVPFTFEEVSLIAKKLGISLDYVINNYENKTAIFNLNLIHTDQALTNYCRTLNRYKEYMIAMQKDPTSSLNSISNSLPYNLYVPFPYISKFRLSRWLHKSNKYKPLKTLEEVIIPDDIKTAQTELTLAIQEIPQTYLIWDMNLVRSFVKEVEYFYQLGYITRSDIENLKNDLHQLINTTEMMASEGYYSNGNKINIYLSNLHFEACYTYLERKDFQISLLRLYSVNSVDTQHPDICRLQKEWIKTLKRYSTLITESGQMQRINFFKQQRKFIDEL